jgi:hypothetical protein
MVLAPSDVAYMRRRLDEDGYLVLRNVVDKDHIAEFSKMIVAAYDTADKFDGGGTYSGHINCFPGIDSRFFYDEIAAYGIVDAIHALRPDRSNDVRATLNFNLPGSVAQHYHIDGLYLDEFLVCNIAVVDTDLANGAMDVLPGTHDRFYKFWEYAVQRKYRLSVRLPMQRGDVLIRKSTLWHRGMPNTTSTPRPLMSLTFGEKSAPAGDPFAVHDGQLHFYPNWFRPSRLGRLRERIFVAAPPSYSAYRFVASLRGNKGYSSY